MPYTLYVISSSGQCGVNWDSFIERCFLQKTDVIEGLLTQDSSDDKMQTGPIEDAQHAGSKDDRLFCAVCKPAVASVVQVAAHVKKPEAEAPTWN